MSVGPRGLRMSQIEAGNQRAAKTWRRIPDGIRVRLRENTQEGMIDGLTELVVGPARNPDGRTQYRVNFGQSERMLVAEDALVIVIDEEGLVLMGSKLYVGGLPYATTEAQLTTLFAAQGTVESAHALWAACR